MKKTFQFVLICIAVLSATTLMGQSKSEKLFEAFRNKPGVTYFAFNKDLADAFDINLEDKGKKVEGDIREIRLLSYNPDKGQLSQAEFLKKSADLLPSSYRLVEDETDDDARVFLLGNSKKATEFHIQIRSDEPNGMCFWISFYGDFDIKDLDGIKAVGREMAHE